MDGRTDNANSSYSDYGSAHLRTPGHGWPGRISREPTLYRHGWPQYQFERQVCGPLDRASANARRWMAGPDLPGVHAVSPWMAATTYQNTTFFFRADFRSHASPSRKGG